MASNHHGSAIEYHDGPQVASAQGLEVYKAASASTSHHHQPSLQSNSSPPFYSNTNTYDGSLYSGHPVAPTAPSAVHHNGRPQAGDAQLVASEKGGPRRSRALCGCSTLVLVLSIIIAILAAAVVGLAAATGVVINNYNNADSDLQDLRVAYTSLEAAAAEATGGLPRDGSTFGPEMEPTTSAGPSGTASQTSAEASPTSSQTSSDFSALTRGCSDRDSGADGSIYESARRYGNPRFAVYCNVDASGSVLFTAFVADFDRCMDACASWNYWAPNNTRCDVAVFIPGWVNVTQAARANAAGSCYLKEDPPSQLEASGDSEVHSGLLMADDAEEE